VHFIVWLVPGFIVNYFLRNELWWTNFLSWFAIVLTAGTLWGPSRTERKQDEMTDEMTDDPHH
jgi:hypothetical protein